MYNPIRIMQNRKKTLIMYNLDQIIYNPDRIMYNPDRIMYNPIRIIYNPIGLCKMEKKKQIIHNPDDFQIMYNMSQII